MTPEDIEARYPYCSDMKSLAETMPEFPKVSDIATEDIMAFGIACLIPLLVIDGKTRQAMKSVTMLLDTAKRVEEAKKAMFATEFGPRLEKDDKA